MKLFLSFIPLAIFVMMVVFTVTWGYEFQGIWAIWFVSTCVYWFVLTEGFNNAD